MLKTIINNNTLICFSHERKRMRTTERHIYIKKIFSLITKTKQLILYNGQN